jgi:hypothetical protein
MSTRLDGVFIPIELDTSKALKQLEQLESKVIKDKKKTDELNKAVDKAEGKPTGGGKTTTGASGEPRPPASRPGTPSFIPPTTQGGSNPVSGTLGKFAGVASKLSGSSTLAEGAIGAASIYGAVRTIALNAPLALEAGRAFSGLSPNDPLFKAVNTELTNLRNSVNYMESYVKSAVTGIGKTYDMATAMARVNGKVPNIQIGYGIYREADLEEDMLQKIFEEFKQREVAAAVGVSMAELFKNGMNR